MSNIETFSTIVKDGEDLSKINAWLNRFRCDEVVRFHVQRVTGDATRLLLEAQDHKRLRIVSSNPPHQSYLQTNKTVPYIDVHFSEPISLETFYGEVELNTVAIANNKLSKLDDGYTLRIDTTGFSLTTAGQYELIFGTGVRHENKIWLLYGERKVIWYTSTIGGSRGGETIRDPEKCILNMARISIEGQHSEQKMLTEFYNAYGVDPDEIILSRLTSGYPEHDRTTLWVIFCRCLIPYVKCTNPTYKACFYQDGTPSEVVVEIGFTESIEEESLEGEIEVDGEVITVGSWELSQDGKLLTVRFTPDEYKHHEVKIASMKSGDFTRTWPYYFSFVIHEFDHTSITDKIRLYDDNTSDYVGLMAPTNVPTSYDVTFPDAPPGVITTLRMDTDGTLLLDEPAGALTDEDIWFEAANSVGYGGTNAGSGVHGDQTTWDFDDTANEKWVIPMYYPAQVDDAGTLKATILWSSAATTGTVRWAVAISARTVNDDMSAESYGTDNTVNAVANGTTGCLNETAISLPNDDGVTPGKHFRLKLTRQAAHGDDDMTGDAIVYGVRVWVDN